MGATKVKRAHNRKTAVALPGSAVQIRMFGLMEAENHLGRVAENPSKPGVPWLLLKYLMVNRGRHVNMQEAIDALWSDRSETDAFGAARVRLRRMREALDPLGLNGTNGLILFLDDRFYLNPDYNIQSDEAAFQELMVRMRKCPNEDPTGLTLCLEMLELFRGPFLAYTEEMPWLSPYRRYYEKEFCELVRSTLERMDVLQDNQGISLLCQRAISIIPENESVHKAIISFLVEHKQEYELIRYISQLSRVNNNGALWLNNLQY